MELNFINRPVHLGYIDEIDAIRLPVKEKQQIFFETAHLLYENILDLKSFTIKHSRINLQLQFRKTIFL